MPLTILDLTQLKRTARAAARTAPWTVRTVWSALEQNSALGSVFTSGLCRASRAQRARDRNPWPLRINSGSGQVFASVQERCPKMPGESREGMRVQRGYARQSPVSTRQPQRKAAPAQGSHRWPQKHRGSGSTGWTPLEGLPPESQPGKEQTERQQVAGRPYNKPVNKPHKNPVQNLRAPRTIRTNHTVQAIQYRPLTPQALQA